MIFDNFKSYFEKACSNNSVDYNSKVKREFGIEVLNASGGAQSIDKQLFSAELVAISVARLHAGKAACFDGLQSEHLSYSHPIVYTVLARLFYLVMLSEYVPEDFKLGMLIPIPRNLVLKEP